MTVSSNWGIRAKVKMMTQDKRPSWTLDGDDGEKGEGSKGYE